MLRASRLIYTDDSNVLLLYSYCMLKTGAARSQKASQSCLSCTYPCM